MKKILLLLVMIITGCTKYNDLSELTIIKSIGINYNEEYIIYAQIIDSIDENNEPIMRTIESHGKTISESFKNIKKLINRDIYLSHIDLLVLKNKLNQNDFQNIINYFIKNNSFRNDFYCVFSDEIKPLLENSKYDEIEILLKKNKETNIKDFNDVIEEFFDNETITLPMITYNENIVYLGNFQYNLKEKNYVQKD